MKPKRDPARAAARRGRDGPIPSPARLRLLPPATSSARLAPRSRGIRPRSRRPNTWREEYAAALAEFLAGDGPREAGLLRAYEIGRRALAEGAGIVEFITAHQAARDALRSDFSAGRAARTGAFLREATSAFELTHRGFTDASAALARMHEFVEREAKRVAQALHDGAGQILAAVHLRLEDLARDLPRPARARIQDARRLLNEAEEQLRALAHEIRPAALDDLGLAAALATLVETFSRRVGVEARLAGDAEGRLPARIETAVYRVVQEALNNVRRHARARRVHVILRRDRNALRLTVRDDGLGPARPLGGEGLGLAGIRERMETLGGRMSFGAGPAGRGAELRCEIPLEAPLCPSKS